MADLPPDLTRDEAARLLRAYRPEGPFAAGRIVAADEPIVRIVPHFELKDVRYQMPSFDGWPGGEATQVVDYYQYELDDGSQYTWSWHGAVYIRKDRELWGTHPGSGRQVGCVRRNGYTGHAELCWAKEGTVQLVRGAHGGQRRPILDAAVIAPLDRTEGTGLSPDEARLLLRQRADAVRRRRPLVLALTLGLGWWDLQRQISRYAEAADGPLVAVAAETPGPFGLRVRGSDGLLYGWPRRRITDPEPGQGDRVWATPIAPDLRVLLIGQRDGSPYVVEPAAPAEVVRDNRPRSPAHPTRPRSPR